MTQRAAIIAIAMTLSGCTAMNYLSGLGTVSSEKSGFDGREIVQVSGNYVMPAAGGSDAFGNHMLGARWESSDPEHVLLMLSELGGYDATQYVVQGESFAVNIDGQITRFPISNTGTVSVPLPYFSHMLDAKFCRLQLIRGANTAEGDFTIESNGGAPTAKASLKRFNDKVLATKSQLAVK